jgi:hypothetical protein
MQERQYYQPQLWELQDRAVIQNDSGEFFCYEETNYHIPANK